MSKHCHLGSLIVPQSFQYARILRADIPLNDIPHKFDLLHSVLQPVQLRDDLIPLIHQIRPNGLDQVKFPKAVSISHLQDPMQLSQ